MKYLLTILSFTLTALTTTAQTQMVTDNEAFLFDGQLYPTARQMYAAVKSGNARSKQLKQGTPYHLVRLAEDTTLWSSASRIALDNKKNHEGWMLTSKLQDRTALIPFLSHFRSAFRTNVQLRCLAPNMNDEEVFAVTNIHYTKAQALPAPWNPDYKMWGDTGNFLLFLNDSLCTAQVVGQTMFYYQPHYKVELVGAECNMPVARQHLKESSYWDENFEINWALGLHTFNFAIKNNSNYTLHLLWDDMVMVSDKSERLIHNGTHFEDRFNKQTNSVVARGTTYSDALLPVTNITLSDTKGWMCPPLVPNIVFSPNDTTNINKVKGQTFKVLFVVSRDGHKYEYTFTLKISDITYTLEQGSMDKLFQIAVSKV